MFLTSGSSAEVQVSTEYQIQRSLRFRASAGAYLSITPTVAGSRTKFTFSTWVKVGSFTNGALLSSDFASTGGLNQIYFSSGSIAFYYEGSGIKGLWYTTGFFRDPSAWYHVVVVADSTQATTLNMVAIYVNGVKQIITFTNLSSGTPPQNTNWWITSTTAHRIGNSATQSMQFDGYLTEVNFIDGQTLTPPSFGEYSVYGHWQPKQFLPTSGYGTTGFYLPFSNDISTTTLCADSSGNGNNWTPFNISLASSSLYSITGFDVTRGTGAFGNATLPAVGDGTNCYHFPKTDATYTLNITVTASLKIEAYCYTDNASAISPCTITANGGVAKTVPSNSAAFSWVKVDLGVTSLSSITVSNSAGWAGSDFWLCCFIVDNAVVYAYTVGAMYDSMYDVPLGGGSSTGNGLGNYAVLNALTPLLFSAAYINGNLQVTGVPLQGVASTQKVSEYKTYWEVTIGATSSQDLSIGMSSTVGNSPDVGGYGWGIKLGRKWSNSSVTTGFSTATAGDIAGFTYDPAGLVFTAYKNNAQVFQITGVVSQEYYFAISGDGVPGTDTVSVNFGQQPFVYTPPSGFKALHTGNLPTPLVVNPKMYHNTYTYLGNGAGLQVGETQKAQDLVTIDRSLRFRASTGARLSRTPSSTTNQKTWTWSSWVKPGVLSGGGVLFQASESSTDFFFIRLLSDKFEFFNRGGGVDYNVRTSALLRNPSMHYHLMMVVDTTQATASERVKLYINGGLQSVLETSSYPPQNFNTWVNQTKPHTYGANLANGVYSSYFDGYMSEVNFVDGQALTPNNFGQFDGNNYWVPKTYTGAYGTNGYRLTFSDPTNTTTIAADSSGNGNNWIAQNISVTPGVTYDSMVDTPTNNYATLNPLNEVSLNGSGATLTNSNLTVTGGSTASTGTFFTGTLLPLAGKFYAEMTIAAVGTANINFGLLGEITSSTYSTVNNILTTLYGSTAQCSIASSGTTIQSNLGFAAANDVYGVAYDAGVGTVQFYRNGSTFGTQINGVQIVNRTFALYVSRDSLGSVSSANINFGQQPFAYTPPSGYMTLCENNIAEITSDIESPDLVWIKSRSAAQSHTWFDSVRGAGKVIVSDTTAAEATDVNSLVQFNKNGFYLGSSAAVNTLNNSYVAWAWKAGTTTVTNTAGSITSQVRANPTSGFGVVTYTGNGVDGSTVGHGLGAVPKLIIVKATNNVGNFRVMHASLTSQTNLYLNATNAADTITTTGGGGIPINPTTSTFTLTTGATANANNVNASTWTYVAYCFAEIEGYSKFGSYTGNGSVDGPFVYCGFRPAFLLIKRVDSGTANWNMFDATCNKSNVTNRAFFPNVSSAEVEDTNRQLDFVANGFKLRQGAPVTTEFNGSGGTFIFIAFAETPLKYALAR